MECIIREWKIEDAAGLAEMLNNKNILNNLRDGLPYPIQRAMQKNILCQCFRLIKRKPLLLQ
jgi:hypothetical protein